MNKQILHRKYSTNWTIVPLASFAAEGNDNFVDGPFGSDLKVSDYTESGVRILQLQNLGDGYFIDKNKIYTTRRKATQLARCITKPGDLIIAKMAEPLARAAVVPDVESEYLIVADLIKLHPADDVDPYYLVNFVNFSDFRKEADRLSTGTTRTRISLSALKRISLPKPPLPIQNEIAAILRCIDLQIEKTQSLITKYQQIKAGLMHDLFTRGVTADGKLRPPREQAPELYHKTPIGWIPKEWVFTTCAKVCEKIIDCKNRTPPETPDGYPVIRTPNVRNGQFVDSELLYTDAKSYAIWTARGKPLPGDIVITREAPVGEVCMIPDHHPEACLGQRMMLYRPNPAIINPEYFLFALQSRQIQSRLDLISGGSTVGHVRVGDIRDLWMFMPSSHSEQEKIAGALIVAGNKLKAEQQQCEKLRHQKHGLMHDLLTGKVAVKVHGHENTI